VTGWLLNNVLEEISKDLFGGNVTRKFSGRNEENREQIFGMRYDLPKKQCECHIHQIQL